MKKIILLYIIISNFILANPKTILFINSYSRDFEGTEKQLAGIENTIISSEYKLYYEYLNNNEIDSKEYLKEYVNLLKRKYANTKIDLIVTTDSFAYEFLQENKNIFKEMPYVIAGGLIQGVSENNTEYILKDFNIEKNLELLKKQFSKIREIKNIYFITDDSNEGNNIDELLKRKLYENKDFNFIWLKNDYEMLKKELEKIGENSVVFELSSYKSQKNSGTDYRSILKKLYDNSKIPIYSVFDYNLYPNSPIVGGYIIDSEKFGKEIGSKINNYFGNYGTNNEKITTKGYSQYKFEVSGLEKFKIKYIPVTSELHSKEIGYLSSRKYEVLTIIITIFISGIILFNYRRNYKAQIKINEQNKQIWELNTDLFKTQKEVIATLGQIIENRSKETANHTTRVAQISSYTGELLGFDEEERFSIEVASPLHDVGKIGIPDIILEKPGKLTDEEYGVIKTHSDIGYNILKDANIPILTIAANIAHEHHERWDGKGYPQGISGEKISVYARITTVADIFDALLSERVYKEPWSIEKVLEFFREERGRIFDPKITDIFLENIEKIIEIREKLKD